MWLEIFLFFSFLLVDISLFLCLNYDVWKACSLSPWLIAQLPTPFTSLSCGPISLPVILYFGYTSLHLCQWHLVFWWCDPVLACYKSSHVWSWCGARVVNNCLAPVATFFFCLHCPPPSHSYIFSFKNSTIHEGPKLYPFSHLFQIPPLAFQDGQSSWVWLLPLHCWDAWGPGRLARTHCPFPQCLAQCCCYWWLTTEWTMCIGALTYHKATRDRTWYNYL